MDHEHSSRETRRSTLTTAFPTGFTLVELMSCDCHHRHSGGLALPAINAARAASRKSACANNLRQFGIGMLSQATRRGQLASGAMDWQQDGAVTEVGWVADLVQQ